MLKVLTLSTLFPHQRAPNLGIFVENQTRRLAESGAAEVRVVAPVGIGPWPLSQLGHYDAIRELPEEEQRNGLHVYRPRYLAMPQFGWRLNDRAIVRSCQPLLARLRSEGFAFDIIDGEFFFPCGVAAAALGKHFGVPVSIKARGADIHFWPTKSGVADKIRRAGALATGMLSVSASLREDMVRLGLERDRIRVHYTGIDLARFAPMDKAEARRELGLPDAPLIVSVGALLPRKGHDLLIDAVAHLPGVHLRIAGQGELRSALQAQIDRSGLGERVKLLGALPYADLPKLYSAADVSALCCHSEGLANVWVESMACGTPVVTFNVDGAPEAINTPEAGLLLAPDQREPKQVAQALEKLLSGRASPEAVRSNAMRFSWENNTATLVEHLHECVRRGLR